MLYVIFEVWNCLFIVQDGVMWPRQHSSVESQGRESAIGTRQSGRVS